MTSAPRKGLQVPADPRPVVIESALLPWVVEGTSATGRFNVLDVGPAMPRTIEFLNSRRCRVHIADLFDGTIIEQQQHLDQSALTDRFAEALWMLDGPLHACLMWDFLNYLTRSALEALNRALSPWVNAHTRAHAFCAVKRSAPLMQHRYSIRSANEIIQEAAPARARAAHPHPWRHLVEALDLFDVDRGALRAGGLVEVILHSTSPQSAEPLSRTSEKVKDIPLRPAANAERQPPPVRPTSQQTQPSLALSSPRAVGQ